VIAKRLIPVTRRSAPPLPFRPVQEALPLPIDQDLVPLPRMTAREEAEADYAISGLSPRYHWMQFFRPQLPEDVVSSRHMERLPDGTPLRLAGLVVCRQMPETAKGFLFVTLEDEWGLSNVIVRPDVYQRFRPCWRLEPLVVVRGVLQRRDGIVNLMAQHVAPLPRDGDLPVPDAHSFR
jgi:error-prone DNA polymerase